jgi:hypothetical protein
MNININGITRPMTVKEMAEFERMAAEIAAAQAEADAQAQPSDYESALTSLGVEFA